MRKTAARCVRVRGPTGCQPCHSQLVPLSGVSEDCASTLEKYGSLSTGDRQSCFSSIDAKASGLALRTTLQLGVTILMPALVALGRKYLVGSYRGNSLAAWVLCRRVICVLRMMQPSKNVSKRKFSQLCTLRVRTRG